MPTVDIKIVRGDDPPPWPDATNHIHLADPVLGVAGLEGGMASGAPSIALRIDYDLGFAAGIVAETSLAAWISTTCALRGAFPEAFAGTPLEGR